MSRRKKSTRAYTSEELAKRLAEEPLERDKRLIRNIESAKIKTQKEEPEYNNLAVGEGSWVANEELNHYCGDYINAGTSIEANRLMRRLKIELDNCGFGEKAINGLVSRLKNQRRVEHAIPREIGGDEITRARVMCDQYVTTAFSHIMLKEAGLLRTIADKYGLNHEDIMGRLNARRKSHRKPVDAEIDRQHVCAFLTDFEQGWEKIKPYLDST